ncbi:MAG: MFS transporter [Candidatus Hodarchaeota archaeon]
MSNKKILHSKKNMASYGFGSMSREFVQMAFNVLVFFYYEVEIGLNVWLIGLALIIFAVYNAINDPLIGYLTNRPFKFTKKWGRRFPWLLLGGIPLGFCYFLIFTPPSIDPIGGAWIIFAWLLFTTCLFDTFHSLFFVNFQSLFPDKFSSIKERRTASGIFISLGIIGVTLGAILPPLFYDFKDLQSYMFQGLIVMAIAILMMLLAIPGFREDREMIDLYLTSYEKQAKRESFLKSTKLGFKQKSFVAYMILYTLYWVIINSLQASLPYVVRFAVEPQYQEARFTTFIMAGLLIGTIISLPIWVKIAQKTNDNGKVMLISATLLGVFVFPLIFINSYWFLVIAILVWGIALGGFWAMIFPVFSDVIDESIVKYKKREEGTYIGIQQFFGRLGLIIQVLSFAIVHELTGFVEGADKQTPLAIWGIHLHAALIPMICIFIGALIFWMLYDLNPKKVSENRHKIKEMGL